MNFVDNRTCLLVGWLPISDEYGNTPLFRIACLNKILNNSCPHLGIDFISERRAKRYGRTQFGYHRQAA